MTRVLAEQMPTIPDNIALIGLSGVGKTTIADYLARWMRRDEVDTDRRIVEWVGISIPEITEAYTMECFRDLESTVVQDVTTSTNQIISTGGGSILRPQNREALKQAGLCVWITGKPERIARQVGLHDTTRPLLADCKTIEDLTAKLGKMAHERNPIYQEMADFTVDIQGLNPRQVAENIRLWHKAVSG